MKNNSTSQQRTDRSIVVIGGGTGSFAVLSGLKLYAKNITALVNMVDDGGSTGQLRDEFGVLPPGDVRQCLVALSNYGKMRDVFTYRFDDGSLKGHPFGNLFLTALERMTGSFAEAVRTAGQVLNITGRVLPITLSDVRLVLETEGKRYEGQRTVEDADLDARHHQPTLSLSPHAPANPEALDAIATADLVVIAPGDLYTSLGPSLVVDGVAEALAKTPAKVLYIGNLVTKHGQTDAFLINDYVHELERMAGVRFIDEIIYNNHPPTDELLQRYAKENEFAVKIDAEQLRQEGRVVLEADVISDTVWTGAQASDKLNNIRSYIRHDPKKTAKQIIERLQA